jgi:hypothetical protein
MIGKFMIDIFLKMNGGKWIRSLRSLGWWMELMVDGGYAHFVRLDSGGSIVNSSQVPGTKILQ